MEWWIYLSGTIISLLCFVYLCYCSWKNGYNITLANVLTYFFFILSSWFSICFVISNILITNTLIRKIKSKKTLTWVNY